MLRRSPPLPGYVVRRTRSRLPRERYPRQRRQISIEDLLARLLRSHKLVDAVREQCVFVFWREMVGARVGAITQPDAINRGVLRVSARTSVQIQELQFHRARMVTQVNEWIAAHGGLLGADPVITEIRFAIGKVGAISDAEQLDRQRQRHVRKLKAKLVPTVTDADRLEICTAAAAIEDEKLRELVTSVRLAWNR